MRVSARFDPFLALLEAHGLPAPQTEYRFDARRQWRADYCWPPPISVIVERDGGFYRGGRRPGTAIGGHSSIQGIVRDMDKANAAQLAGFLYLRFTPRALATGAVLPLIRQALQTRSG